MTNYIIDKDITGLRYIYKDNVKIGVYESGQYRSLSETQTVDNNLILELDKIYRGEQELERFLKN